MRSIVIGIIVGVLAAAGRSVDDLVRVSGKWLIKTRNVAPQN